MINWPQLHDTGLLFILDCLAKSVITTIFDFGTVVRNVSDFTECIGFHGMYRQLNGHRNVSGRGGASNSPTQGLRSPTGGSGACSTGKNFIIEGLKWRLRRFQRQIIATADKPQRLF